MTLSEGITPHTLEWNNARCGKLTSSEIHKIFVSGRSAKDLIGVGGKTYINRKIGEILTGEVKESPETEAILHGLTEEPYAKERYTQITNIELEDPMFFQYNAIAGGTTDGCTTQNGIIKSICEVKCPNTEKHLQVLAINATEELKDIDAQYWHQPQANMLFTDADYCDFISFDPRVRNIDLQLRIIRVYPDIRWRKQFAELIDWIAEYISEKLEDILKAPERNLAFRIDTQSVKNLQESLDSVQRLIKS